MINFFKYQACGNDFLVIDHRKGQYSHFSAQNWEKLCQRHCGVGADGVLLLEESNSHAYKMHYLNSDGHRVLMCGNGARTLAQFASRELKIPYNCIEGYSFEAGDGIYFCVGPELESPSILMTEIKDQEAFEVQDLYDSCLSSFYINTGVPHIVYQLSFEDLKQIDLLKWGKKIRNHERFPEGVNINFVAIKAAEELSIRTFERGVEGETLSCGTGALAAAIFYREKIVPCSRVLIQALGGELIIDFKESKAWLSGRVEKVYEGRLESKFFFNV